ncbi:unnamed protein product [Ambrosiozyma monospora]|uniref:Unnamed protein product n=1 Tax=Ambrosiozyma monospora TaxID=43982 RepID=A0A9W7DJ99_AMBMO|nr:unnamed protein product [Ambrosiozyma monospora]
MLERISNQLQQPDIVVQAHNTRDDPLQRFILVVKWYLSCWHIAPKAVKKPLNPILGEYFTCYWDLPNGKQAYYVAEQTSHHPPKSSYFYIMPSENIRVDGIVIPKSRFLGNSTAAVMDGVTKLSFLDYIDSKTGEPEYYTLTQPNIYARGILFGTMKLEMGDHMVIKCPATGYEVDIEFKTKGLISGTYDAIEGTIKETKTGKALYLITGKWNKKMHIKDLATNKETLFFDCDTATPLKPKVRDISEQGEFESRRLWEKVTDALAERNHEVATEEKYKIEDSQRLVAKKREADGVEFYPKLFRKLSVNESVKHGNDVLEFVIYKDNILNKDIRMHDPEALNEHIFEIAPFLPKQKFNPEFEIPAFEKVKEEKQHSSSESETAAPQATLSTATPTAIATNGD